MLAAVGNWVNENSRLAERTMSRQNLLTDIIVAPFFTNVLGLLSFFFVLAGTSLPMFYFDHLPRNMPQWLVVVPGFLSIAAVAAFDLWWRLRQEGYERRTRLLHSTLGGCMMMTPLWIFYPGMVLWMVILGVLATLATKM